MLVYAGGGNGGDSAGITAGAVAAAGGSGGGTASDLVSSSSVGFDKSTALKLDDMLNYNCIFL